MIGQIFAAIGFLREIFDTIKSLMAFIEKNKNEKWFNDWSAAFKDFTQKTPEERKDLAKSIRDLLGGLG